MTKLTKLNLTLKKVNFQDAACCACVDQFRGDRGALGGCEIARLLLAGLRAQSSVVSAVARRQTSINMDPSHTSSVLVAANEHSVFTLVKSSSELLVTYLQKSKPAEKKSFFTGVRQI